MINIFNLIKDKIVIDNSCYFSDYRAKALELLKQTPTCNSEQYRNIDMKKIFEEACKSSNISEQVAPEFDNSKEGFEQMDIKSFAKKNSKLFNKYFSTAFSDGAIEQVRGTKFKDRSKQHSCFVDMNTAFLNCGTVTSIAENQSIKEPIEMEINHKDIVLGRRDLIIVGKFSKATLVINNSSQHTLLNRVCEIYLEENASLDIIEIDMSNGAKNTITNTIIAQSKGSSCKHYSIITSKNVVRNNIKSMLNGEGADVQLFGANLVYDSGVVSANTVVEHNVSKCTSDEQYKNIATDEGVSDFAGIIFVNEDAQQTNANQRNDNIVLSDSAKTHTKPQLEIYADDVKCTHGATVGQLSSDALFYMMQRGISKSEANKLLLTGFLNDILMKIENEQIRERLVQKMNESVLAVQ